MNKLPMPVICECGYVTMDANKAIQHIKDKHPEELIEVKDEEEVSNVQ